MEEEAYANRLIHEFKRGPAALLCVSQVFEVEAFFPFFFLFFFFFFSSFLVRLRKARLCA